MPSMPAELVASDLSLASRECTIGFGEASLLGSMPCSEIMGVE